MAYLGIDYGHGITNINPETGIRYGVISHHKVGTAWYEDSEAVYPENEEDEEEMDCIDPLGFEYAEDGYACQQFGDDSDIFIMKSPYFTYGQFCSPCAPGAIDLSASIIADSTYPGGAHDESGTPLENNRGYCFGHDWFEAGKAPYPVYSVKTGKLVEPEEE